MNTTEEFPTYFFCVLPPNILCFCQCISLFLKDAAHFIVERPRIKESMGEIDESGLLSLVLLSQDAKQIIVAPGLNTF